MLQLGSRMKARFVLLFLGSVFLSCENQPPITADGTPDAPRLYNIHCAACHKPDGTGGIAGAKNLVESTLNQQQIENAIANGQGDMMPFASILTSEEIEALSIYVHKFKD